MCTPKSQGGMGFRDVGVFNSVLLAKQVWRLVVDDDSLCSRVLKTKYFPQAHVLDARLDPTPSYVWRSIWGSKALFKEGIVMRVGNASSIKVWHNPWLLDSVGRFVTTPCLMGCENLTVVDLRDGLGA